MSKVVAVYTDGETTGLPGIVELQRLQSIGGALLTLLTKEQTKTEKPKKGLAYQLQALGQKEENGRYR